ncbi:hypothetical protein PsYK624_163360 [Phanerochaete sordida]|uniref:Uncharacterized protein n=1 Tax=Phanerochaete sordida TaxID=48140 RepID=A0A9P3GS35_9APHY|nr:hypothetical protein PsYK624_163360 [Phanerochaete sordida]
MPVRLCTIAPCWPKSPGLAKIFVAALSPRSSSTTVLRPLHPKRHACQDSGSVSIRGQQHALYAEVWRPHEIPIVPPASPAEVCTMLLQRTCFSCPTRASVAMSGMTVSALRLFLLPRAVHLSAALNVQATDDHLPSLLTDPRTAPEVRSHLIPYSLKGAPAFCGSVKLNCQPADAADRVDSLFALCTSLISVFTCGHAGDHSVTFSHSQVESEGDWDAADANEAALLPRRSDRVGAARTASADANDGNRRAAEADEARDVAEHDAQEAKEGVGLSGVALAKTWSMHAVRIYAAFEILSRRR